MKNKFSRALLFSISLLTLCSLSALAQQKPLGVFEGSTDIGNVLKPGAATFDPKTGQYEVSGSGYNIWFDHDEFHYLWKRMSGDFILYTRARFVGKGVDPHRKVGWMVRQSLEGNAPHINAVVHGDGLTSLQYREAKGDSTQEIRSGLTGADVIQLERKGNTYTMRVAKFGQPFVTEEVTILDLGDDVYVGLFVGSHNKDVLEKGIYSDVRITVPAPDDLVQYRQYLGSNLELLDVNTGDREIIYTSPKSLQAPNWTPDNKTLIYNSEGLIYTFDLATRTPKKLNTGNVTNNNNDHVLSFDGKMLGLSSGVEALGGSIIYTVPVTGGEPKQITPKGPSYLHSWSPDGKSLIFTGQRNNEFDIYRVPAKGGKEVQLTTAKGLDDGSEYSPDGKHIYFNSNRSGDMQIWRMKADGSEQVSLTNSDFHDWFPHVSPDGKWLVFVSFLKEEVEPGDHPFYKHVYLRMMPVSGGEPKVIAYLYGGQGSINTPSWSPDSKKVAFISNTVIPEAQVK
ncbi:biopolymer transporter TolR [Pontibacter sp. E15-1]|uniref:biopolymer transporter TolR n=1 Tax=Pontibacter sp. E15-1 TaxID=2919918 RepID=UPI001F4FC9D6|nr:biopolymer transporter TolR [Pontibacter sp. E15-1]MCJ8167333.1 biopolymer transporter TolR [Pontibacter sp. E15-1]